MQINSLKLFHFRNFIEESVSFSGGVNLLTGSNGQGKTNLVEAISFVSSGRSFRTARLADLVLSGSRSGSAFASISHHQTDLDLGIVIERGKKTGYINGEPVKTLADYAGKLLTVAFSPSDLEIVKGAPFERRRLLDRHISELRPGMIIDYAAYGRAVKSKNALLSRGNAGRESIMPWNEIIAEHAVRIVNARQEFVRALGARAARIHSAFAAADGELQLNYKSAFAESGTAAEKEHILRVLELEFPREVERGSCAVGPHRDDMQISIGGKDARVFASQGQTRSVVMALKLAVIELLENAAGETPVILLDDVDSELDAARSAALFSLIAERQSQVLITATEPRLLEIFGAQRCALFSVESGHVKPI